MNELIEKDKETVKTEKVSLEKLMENVSSLYKLCNLAALRAIELNSGMKSLVERDPTEKVTTVAIREIAENKVKMKRVKE